MKYAGTKGPNEGMSPEFAAALVKAQSNVEGAKKGRSNPQFKSKYADLGAVWDAVSAALTDAGIAVLQFPCDAAPGHVGLETVLVFQTTGEMILEKFELPVKDSTNAQAVGSALTYARRYALSSILGVCPEDDDGNGAAAGPGKAQAGAGAKSSRVSEASGISATEALKQFAGAEVDVMKKVYQLVKSSGAIEEPAKTKMLADMASQIKAMQPKKDKE